MAWMRTGTGPGFARRQTRIRIRTGRIFVVIGTTIVTRGQDDGEIPRIGSKLHPGRVEVKMADGQLARA
jgi:hypothetical protein